MKTLKITSLIGAVILLTLSVQAETLNQAYQNASPGAGYDKYVVLDPDITYTGGLNISDESACIISCGGQIDLENGRIYIDSDASLDICGVIIRNGISTANALDYEASSKGSVDHCTFYDNYNSLRFWQFSNLDITSCIFNNSSHYGVHTHEAAVRWMAFNDAYQNPGGHYMEYCSG